MGSLPLILCVTSLGLSFLSWPCLHCGVLVRKSRSKG